MRSNSINTCLHLLIVFVLIFTFVGCETDQNSENDNINLAVETSHERHNHGPGEHVDQAIPTTEETAVFDWCLEHAVPESQCTKCNPKLIAKFKEANDWCAGHDLPESHCRLCNPDITFPQEEILRSRRIELADNEIEVSLLFRPNASVCATDGALIQFASANTAERAGISVQTVRASQYESVIEAPAEVVFDETEVTIVTSTVAALVSRWLVSPGDIIHQGEVLAILQSPEITQLKSSLLSSYANYEVERKELERHREMRERNLISEADFDRQAALTHQAQAEFVSTKGLLLSAGLNESDIDDIIEQGNLSNQFALHSPATGMVVERVAQLGQLLEAGKSFAMLANTTSMWIEARLTEKQLKHIKIRQKLTFGSDGEGLNRVGGEIIWISRCLDPHTRTGTVRAKVINPDHGLHAGEFGRVRIVQKDHIDIALVPKDAVQWEGCCNVVFVKETDVRYRPRKVQLLDGEGPFYQVTDGVKPGEQVVVEGSFLLKTELKKTSIGAGCCGLEPVG